MFIPGRSQRAGDFSLVEANCAANCLDYKGRLDPDTTFRSIYNVAARIIVSKMGDNPDIADDTDTRVHISPLQRRITRRATEFVVANTGVIVDDRISAYTYENALLLTFQDRVEEHLEWFRDEKIVPAVDHLVQDATALQARL